MSRFIGCWVKKQRSQMGVAVDSLKGQEALQRDIDRWEHWATINSIKGNKNKCHLGWSNARHKSNLGEEWLEGSPAGRDLDAGVSAGSVEASTGPWHPEDKQHPGVHQSQQNQLGREEMSDCI